MTKRKNEQVSIFAAGMLFATGICMAVQDYLGLERYVEYLQNHWVNLPWLFGAVCAVIGVFALLFWMEYPAKPEAEDQGGG